MLRVTLLSGLFGILLGAVQSARAESPRVTVEALFEAMRAGDGDAVRKRVREGSVLQRATPEGIEDLPFEDWANWIDTLEPDQADESLFWARVTEQNNIATIWAPFVIRIGGDIKGCGTNHFTLARESNRWLVIHGVDTKSQYDCEAFEKVCILGLHQCDPRTWDAPR
ncbi:MAG: hypothetical protein AAF950_09200 [Pseudomonadota bacterium]